MFRDTPEPPAAHHCVGVPQEKRMVMFVLLLHVMERNALICSLGWVLRRLLPRDSIALLGGFNCGVLGMSSLPDLNLSCVLFSLCTSH